MTRSAPGGSPRQGGDHPSSRAETHDRPDGPEAREAPSGPESGPTAAARPAVDALFATVYHELRRIAHHHLRRERPGHTLHTTALVNEAYVRLAALEHVIWRDRAHFLALAARAMRRVLIDYAVARQTRKRGDGQTITIQGDLPGSAPALDDIIAIDTALTRLEQLNPRLVRVVECRFFAGLSIDEAAEALALSPATVKRDWKVARAWLNRELVEP